MTKCKSILHNCLYFTANSLQVSIEEAWKSLHQHYAKVLGLKKGDELTEMIDMASDKLSNKT